MSVLKPCHNIKNKTTVKCYIFFITFTYSFIDCSHFWCNVIVTFLKNTAVYKVSNKNSWWDRKHFSLCHISVIICALLTCAEPYVIHNEPTFWKQCCLILSYCRDRTDFTFFCAWAARVQSLYSVTHAWSSFGTNGAVYGCWRGNGSAVCKRSIHIFWNWRKLRTSAGMTGGSV